MVSVNIGREEGLASQFQHFKLRNKINFKMTNFCFVVVVVLRKKKN